MTNENLRIKQEGKPLYQLNIGTNKGKFCKLVAEIWHDYGKSGDLRKKYGVTDFVELGYSKKLWRDERVYFEEEELEKLLLEVDQIDYPVNAFMFSRRTGDRKTDDRQFILHECPVEFFHIEVS